IFNTTATSTQNIANMDLIGIRFDAGAAVTLTISSDLTLDGETSFSFVLDSTGNNTITGSGKLVLKNAPLDVIVAQNPGKEAVIAAQISGDQGVTKMGVGTLALTAISNTYTGPTQINDGTLRFAVGLNVSSIVVGDGSGAAGSAV